MKGLHLKYFILKPYKDTPYGAASREALDTYADTIEGHDEPLARGIRGWLSNITKALDRDRTKEVLPPTSADLEFMADVHENTFLCASYYADGRLWDVMKRLIPHYFILRNREDLALRVKTSPPPDPTPIPTEVLERAIAETTEAPCEAPACPVCENPEATPAPTLEDPFGGQRTRL